MLLPSLLKPVLAGALLPNVPDVSATPLAELSPLSETGGVLRLRERGRGDAHRQDGRRRGTPGA